MTEAQIYKWFDDNCIEPMEEIKNVIDKAIYRRNINTYYIYKTLVEIKQDAESLLVFSNYIELIKELSDYGYVGIKAGEMIKHYSIINKLVINNDINIQQQD